MRRPSRRVESSTTNNNGASPTTKATTNADLVFSRSDLPVRYSPPPHNAGGRRKKRHVPSTFSRRRLFGGKQRRYPWKQKQHSMLSVLSLLVVLLLLLVVVVVILIHAIRRFTTTDNNNSMPVPALHSTSSRRDHLHATLQHPVSVRIPQHDKTEKATTTTTKTTRRRRSRRHDHDASNQTMFQLPPAMDRDELEQALTSDFGNLDVRLFADDTYLQRVIYKNLADQEGFNRAKEEATFQDDYDDNYYAFDDDAAKNPYLDYDDETIRTTKTCRRTAWHRRLPIDCNKLHEFDFLSRIAQGESKFVGAGAYREVHLVELPGDELVVLKEYRWAADYDYRDFEFMRMDALVSEIFSGPNSKMVNIYGFCGLGIISEGMPGGDFEDVATPLFAEDGDTDVVLNDKTSVDPKNDLTPTQKLVYSLEMAEALQELHGYKGGVIVHDDVHLGQFLISKDGHLKLHDFNRAEPMLWNEKDREYCRYRNNRGNGVWRAPEEYLDGPLNEKIDVFSLGVNMYAMLTGLTPFHNEETTEDAQKRWIDGDTPPIDPRYKANSFAEGKLVEIIQKCWEYDADRRIDIFAVVQFLRKAVAEIVQRQGASEADQQENKEKKKKMMMMMMKRRK